MYLNELLPENARNGLRIQGKPKSMSDADFKNARRVMMNLVKHHDVIMRLVEDAAIDSLGDDNWCLTINEIYKELKV